MACHLEVVAITRRPATRHTAPYSIKWLPRKENDYNNAEAIAEAALRPNLRAFKRIGPRFPSSLQRVMTP